MLRPAKDAGRRRIDVGFLSITATVCPPSSRAAASSLPTRPHPTTTTCTHPPPTRTPAARAHATGRRLPRPGRAPGAGPVRVTGPAWWHADSGPAIEAGRAARVQVTQAAIRRQAPRHRRAGASAHLEAHRSRGVLVGRDLLHRLRHGGDPLRDGPGRLEPDARARRPDPDRTGGRGPADRRGLLVPPNDLRIPGWRWVVRGEPGEPGRERLSGGGCIDPRRLHPHRGGLDLRGGGGDRLDPVVPWPRRPSRPAGPRTDRDDHAGQPPWREGVGAHLRGPHLRLHPHARGAPRVRHRPVVRSGHLRRDRRGAVRPGALRGDPVRRGLARSLLHPPRLLVGCRCADGHRGDRRRCPRVPQAGVEERLQDPHLDGGDPGDALLRHCVAGPPAPPLSGPQPHGAGAAGAPGLRQRAALRPAPVRHGGDPRPRREHGVRRLPEALVDHRPRRLPAAPDGEPG